MANVRARPAHVQRARMRWDTEQLRKYQEKSTEAKARKKRGDEEKAAPKERQKAPNTYGMKGAPKPDPVEYQKDLDKRYP